MYSIPAIKHNKLYLCFFLYIILVLSHFVYTMTQRVNRSDVWNNYTKLSTTKVKCNLCAKELAVSRRSTTGMHVHLQSIHPTVAADTSKAANSTLTITGFVSQRTCSDGQKEKIILALAKVIAENMLPITLIESESATVCTA